MGRSCLEAPGDYPTLHEMQIYPQTGGKSRQGMNARCQTDSQKTPRNHWLSQLSFRTFEEDVLDDSLCSRLGVLDE